jgi:hypothetical protein
VKKEYDFSRGRRGPVISNLGKTRITISLDNATLERFEEESEKSGMGYQTLINDALAQSAGAPEGVTNRYNPRSSNNLYGFSRGLASRTRTAERLGMWGTHFRLRSIYPYEIPLLSTASQGLHRTLSAVDTGTSETPRDLVGRRQKWWDLPGAGLEPARSRLRGIFVLATAFAAESHDSFGVWTFSLPLSGAL